MRRLFWISVGVGVTIYALRKISQVNAAASQFTPAGIAGTAAGVAANLREAGTDFRESMKQHEERLTDALFGQGTDPARKEHSADSPVSDYDLDEGDPEEYF